MQIISLSVLIGQRGNDRIITGPGNHLVIGDNAFNKITTNLDFPRIYQVYRSLGSPAGSGYAPGAPAVGYTFMNDFDLFPNPFRYVDSQASLIDQLITVDDISSESHVIRDVLGISGSIATNNDYCMHPMIKVVPGFTSKTDMLPGNDGKLLALVW